MGISIIRRVYLFLMYMYREYFLKILDWILFVKIVVVVWKEGMFE